MINKDKYSLQFCCVPEYMKPIVEPRRTKPKTYRQAPTHWLKFYKNEAVYWSEARTADVRLKSDTDWVNNKASSLPHNIQAIVNSFITVS